MNRKVKEAYEKNKFQVPTSPTDANYELFLRRTKRAKGEDIQVEITNVYRISTGPNKDFIFYHRKVIIPDLVGNKQVHSEFVGRDEVPQFRYNYNVTGEAEATTLSGFKTEYSIPYSPEKMREILTTATVERPDDEPVTVGADSSNTNFVLVVPGGRKFGNFAADDFINRSFDELSQFAANGTFVERSQQQEEREGNDSEIENARRKIESIRQKQQQVQGQKTKAKEEETKDGQKGVEQQSDATTTTVKSEARAIFEKEGTRVPEPAQPVNTPMSAQEIVDAEAAENDNNNGRTERARPETEQIKEEVVFVLGKPEDQNVNEDEEIAKQFEEQEAAKGTKRGSRKNVNNNNNNNTG